MVKKAFCVGINDYPGEDSDLRGCVNDAEAWATLLTDHFDFPASEIRLLTDAEATKAKILAGLKDLLTGAKAGDVLVFTNSSHGSYLLDRSGDEERYDQVVCPYDITTNVILDDELRELFTALPREAHVVAIMDNCHSGSGTRLAGGDRRIRFFDPAKRGDPVLPRSLEAPPPRRNGYSESDMNEVLLSGCRADESSYDDRIGGVFQGAMSYHALKAIRDANYKLTYAQLHARLTDLLANTEYRQHPQLEGRDENKDRQIFS